MYSIGLIMTHTEPQHLALRNHRVTVSQSCSCLDWIVPVQGAFDPNKISGVGTIFGLLVHVLPEPNEQRGLEPIMRLNW